MNIMFSCLYIFNCLLCCLISISGLFELDSNFNAYPAVSKEPSVSEQSVSAKGLILEKPSRSGGCLHAYEPLDTLFSSTPDGYEPFYISHFGRHGSRFAGSEEDFAVIDELMKYSSRNRSASLKSSVDSDSTSIAEGKRGEVNLSQTGEQLLSDLIALKQHSEGRYGQLTQRGAWEHRSICRRMYSHYPEVFSNPERRRVIAVSTNSGRVIASKENFFEQLVSFAPDLEVSDYTAKDTLEYPAAVLATSGYPMSKEVRRNERFPDTGESTAQLMKGFDSRRLRSLLFTFGNNDSLLESNDRNTALKQMTALPEAGQNELIDDSIFSRIQFCGRHYECIGDTLVPNFEKYFTAEELYYLWTRETLIWYAHSCACDGADHTRMHYYGAGILKTIIEEADSAIAGNSVAANLRFSHDTYLYPLLALMGVEGADYQGPAIGALDRVIDFTNVCTAGNVQFIFYHKSMEPADAATKENRKLQQPRSNRVSRNNQTDVLVKILKNEKEVLIPSLAPATGCYYNWETLRKYFLQRIAQF